MVGWLGLMAVVALWCWVWGGYYRGLCL